MSLSLLLADELRGFYRSKVMIALWVGLPALSILLYGLSPDAGGIPLPTFTSLLVGSIGGALSSVMLTVSIIHERDRHVFDLFVVRPIRRHDLLLAKFFAVYGCVAVAGLLAQAVGVLMEYFANGDLLPATTSGLLPSLVILLSMMAISCSTGVLIGVASPSVLVGVILILYGGNQLSAVVLLPVLTAQTEVWFPLVPGAAISVVLLLAAIFVFGRKEI